MSGFWRSLVADGKLRWLGPEKGVIHLATAAVVNAVWDLWAKLEGKPLWKLLADMTPEELVACVDFRYITDALTPEQALELLRERGAGRAAREAEIVATGSRAYTTSAGWLGLRRREGRGARARRRRARLHHVKMKVGAQPRADDRRAALIRRALGPERRADDGRQPGLGRRRARSRRCEAVGVFDPWWIEEPTSPDDVLGHARIRREIAPVRVATGEHVQNRVIFKQLFQAERDRRLPARCLPGGGVNEAIAVLLLAAEFGRPGLPACGRRRAVRVRPASRASSTTSRSAPRRKIASSNGSITSTSTSVEPAVVRNGRYVPPLAPGYSIEMLPSRSTSTSFPTGLPGRLATASRVEGVTWSPSRDLHRRDRHAARRSSTATACCSSGLLLLRAGPGADPARADRRRSALTTPVFLTSRNIGNVFSQTAVIAVLALGQLLVIVTRGIDLSVGATVALSSVVGALVFGDDRTRALIVIAAMLGTGVAVGARQRAGLRLGPRPAPVHRHAGDAQHRQGPRALGSDGTLISGMPQSVQTIGGGSIDWLPYSIFVVAGIALALLVLDDADGLGPLALRRRRQPRGGPALEHPGQARARHASTC